MLALLCPVCVAFLKLVQSLLREIDNEPDARARAAAVITCASATGSSAVAEGVESAG